MLLPRVHCPRTEDTKMNFGGFYAALTGKDVIL